MKFEFHNTINKVDSKWKKLLDSLELASVDKKYGNIYE